MGGSRPLVLPERAAADDRPHIRLRPLSEWWAAALALPVLVAAAVKLALESEHLTDPGLTAAYRAYLIAAPMLIGLAWWRRRPASAYGPLLVIFGLAAVPLALQSSSAPLVAALGVLGEGVYFCLTLFLYVAFPRGRVAAAAERWLLLGFAASTALFIVPTLLFVPDLPLAGTPLAGCAPECPSNPFDVATSPGLADAAAHAALVLGAVPIAALGVLSLVRLRRASRPQRRELAAVAATAFPIFPALTALGIARVVSLPAPVVQTLAWLFTAAGIVFCLGFLAALLHGELFAGAALRRLLRELALRPAPSRWRDAVAAALDDASLRLAYWDPARGSFRQADGTALERPTPGDGRHWTAVDFAGRPVAALTTDEALAAEPELLDAAAQATLIAVRSGHLESELRDSRRRLMEAGNDERRRIERDLHDGAQQRLVALRVRLEAAAERPDLPRATRIALSACGADVDEAIDELRRIAHGLYPALLEQYGVAEAVRSASRHTALAVRIVDEGLGRWSTAVESTLYFCCLEALQNVAKHAGPYATATVRLGAADSGVWFAVEDDGVGFDVERVDGVGLSNMCDRVAAMGGSLDVDSAPGRGTRLAGRFPAGRPA